MLYNMAMAYVEHLYASASMKKKTNEKKTPEIIEVVSKNKMSRDLFSTEKITRKQCGTFKAHLVYIICIV